MHLTDDFLHALLDNELSGAALSQAQDHLAGCSQCRARLDGLAQRAAFVSAQLNLLEPGPAEAPRPAPYAFDRLKQKETHTMWKNIFRRPVWATLIVVAVLAFAFSFQPVRAFASSFLDLFRVQQITLLPMDMRSMSGPSGEPTIGQAIGQLFSDSVQFTKKPGDPQVVASAAEASQLAGFNVRQWNGAQPTQMTVESGTAFNFTINRDQAQAVLDESGNQGLQLPASLDGVKISVDIPNGVSTSYGQCVAARSADPTDPDDQGLLRGENCITLLQVPSPSATTDPQIDPAEIAQIGLQFLGMSPDEAAKFSQSVDWASTLVIPIPRGDVSYRPVQVDGVSGNLITELKDKNSDNPPGYTILWVKDGVIYAVVGTANPDKGLEIANNLN